MIIKSLNIELNLQADLQLKQTTPALFAVPVAWQSWEV